MFLRALIAGLALATSFAVAGPTPQPVKSTTLKLTQGTVTRALPVVPPCLKCTFTDVTQGGQRKIGGGSLGGNWAQFPVSGGPVTTDWLAPAAPPPPPPIGGLDFDLSYVDRAGAGFLRFKAYIDAAIASNGQTYDERPIDIALMFKLTGDPTYAAAAVAEVDRQVIAAAAAGAHPAVAGDSYLGVGEMIGEVAITYPWASPSQQAQWKAYLDQANFNVWNASLATWNGLAAPWSSWSTDNPGNNYYYSFIESTMWSALATGSTAIVHDGKTALEYLRTDRIPLLAGFYAAIPGGGSMEGTGYGASHRTLFGELYQPWLDSGQGDLRNAHETNSGELWVHITMPTLDRFAPIGDQSRSSIPWWYDYHRAIVLQVYRQTQNAQVRSDIGWLLSNLRNGDGTPYTQMQNTYSFRYDLIPYTAGPPPIVRTFYAPEVGVITARTGWDLDATLLVCLMGQYSESHAHQEQGGCTLFGHRSWLVVANNIWSASGLHQDTGDKNIPRFERNGNVIPQQLHHSVNVTAYAPNPATGDTHFCGDVSPMYQDAGVRWTRCIDFVNGATTINDDMTLGAGVTAIEQIQVPSLPTITGDVITIGELQAIVLQPANAQITSAATGYGGWRIEIRGTPPFKFELRAN